MEKPVVIPAKDGPATHEMFYQLIGRVPESEAAWAERQATLRSWLGSSFRAILAVHRSLVDGRFRLLPAQGRRDGSLRPSGGLRLRRLARAAGL